MKILKNTLAILAFVSLAVVMSCGGGTDPEPDPPGKTTSEALEAAGLAWAPTVVTNDGDPRTEWENFELSFTANAEFDGGNFSTSGSPSEDDAVLVWPASGTWAFEENADGSLNLGRIVRSDGITMNAQVSLTTDNDGNVTGGSLAVDFEIPEPAARVAGFTGPWEFTFSPQ